MGDVRSSGATARTAPALHVRAWRLAARAPRASVGTLLLLALVIASVGAPIIAPYPPDQMQISDALQPPTLRHLFGTDTFGRDVLSLVLFGGQPTLAIGGATVAAAFFVGVPIGVVAGYLGGVVDMALMAVLELALALPSIVLALGIIAFVGPGPQNVVLALTVVNAPLLARVARGSTLAIRSQAYVDAARAIGDSDHAIMLRQIAPNIATPVLVQASLAFAYALLAEASLSFLGLGTQPSAPSWGRMLTDAMSMVATAPWTGVFPGLFIVVAVLSLNLIGDGLRDILDPALRTSAGIQ